VCLSLIAIRAHMRGQTVLTRLRLEGNRIDEAHIRDVLADIEEKRQPPAVSFIPQHFVVAHKQQLQQGTHAPCHALGWREPHESLTSLHCRE
jgi:hypothetical protein